MKPEDIRSGRWRDPTGKEYDFADHTPAEYRAHCQALLAKGFVPLSTYPVEIVTLRYPERATRECVVSPDIAEAPGLAEWPLVATALVATDDEFAAPMARAAEADSIHTRDTIDLSEDVEIIDPE